MLNQPALAEKKPKHNKVSGKDAFIEQCDMREAQIFKNVISSVLFVTSMFKKSKKGHLSSIKSNKLDKMERPPAFKVVSMITGRSLKRG